MKESYGVIGKTYPRIKTTAEKNPYERSVDELVDRPFNVSRLLRLAFRKIRGSYDR